MSKIERSIARSDELTKAFVDYVSFRNLSMMELARRANLGCNTVYRVCHPDEAKGVSKKTFVRIIEVLQPEPEQKVGLYSLAGIDIVKEPDVGLFAARVDLVVKSLELNQKNEALLQRLTLEHILAIGKLLQAAQESPVKSRRRQDRFNMRDYCDRWRRVT